MLQLKTSNQTRKRKKRTRKIKNSDLEMRDFVVNEHFYFYNPPSDSHKQCISIDLTNLLPMTSKDKKTKENLSKAHMFFVKKKYWCARDYFLLSRDIHTSSSDWHCYIGICYFHVGDFHKSISSLKDSLVNDTFNIHNKERAHFWLGMNYIQTSLFKEARQSLELACSESNDINYYFQMGLVLYISNEFSKAIKYFSMFFQKAKNDLWIKNVPKILINMFKTYRAESYRRLGLYEKAFKDFSTLSDTNTNHRLYYSIAMTYCGMNPPKYVHAHLALERTVNIADLLGCDDELMEIYKFKRGYVSAKNNEFLSCLSDFKWVINNRIKRGCQIGKCIHFECGKVNFKLKKYKEALKHFSYAIEYDNMKIVFLVARGIVYYSLKQFKKAIIDYNNALALQTNKNEQLETLIKIGRCYKRMRMRNIAIEYFTKAIEARNPKNTSALFYRGRCKYEMGQFKSSIEDFTKAINGSDKRLYYNERGAAYVCLGLFKNAFCDYKRSNNLQRLYFQTFKMGVLCGMMGKEDSAKSLFESSKLEEERFWLNYFMLAIYHLKKGNYNDSEMLFNESLQRMKDNFNLVNKFIIKFPKKILAEFLLKKVMFLRFDITYISRFIKGISLYKLIQKNIDMIDTSVQDFLNANDIFDYVFLRNVHMKINFQKRMMFDNVKYVDVNIQRNEDLDENDDEKMVDEDEFEMIKSRKRNREKMEGEFCEDQEYVNKKRRLN